MIAANLVSALTQGIAHLDGRGLEVNAVFEEATYE